MAKKPNQGMARPHSKCPIRACNSDSDPKGGLVLNGAPLCHRHLLFAQDLASLMPIVSNLIGYDLPRKPPPAPPKGKRRWYFPFMRRAVKPATGVEASAPGAPPPPPDTNLASTGASAPAPGAKPASPQPEGSVKEFDKQ